jgi:hypothetical protein
MKFCSRLASSSKPMYSEPLQVLKSGSNRELNCIYTTAQCFAPIRLELDLGVSEQEPSNF